MNEYTIDEHGVTLTTPWQDADHLNIRTESGTVNFHAEAKCAAIPAPPECSPIMQTAAQKIGQNFISWGDLGINPESCIEWVQFSRANYHFGENGEEALCLTKPEPEPEPVKPDPVFRWVSGDPVVDCEDGTVTVVSVEEAAGYYLGNDGEWHLGGFFPTGETSTETTSTDAGECPVATVDPPVTPPVDPPMVVPPVKPIDAPATIQPVLDPPAELAVTGGFDFFPILIGAAVMIVAGGVLLRKAFAR